MDNSRQSSRSRITPSEMSSSKSSRPNQLIFYHDPASLQKLSAVTVASQLWRHELSKYDIHARPLKPGLPLAKSIPNISKPLEKIIDRCIEPVRLSLLLWLKTHFFLVFLPYEKEYNILKKYYDCLTWQPDCSIDYETTAEKLIDCVELGVICKYKVACTYCLEDSIRKLWNELPQDYHTLSNIWYAANFLVRYWDCRMKVDSGGSMTAQLFDKLLPENWSAWKYCWSRLPSDHRIDKAVAMIESKLGMKRYVKNLLPLLTKLELVKILPKCTRSIVTVLATSPENVTYALQTWQFVKNFTTRDSFVKMFEDVLGSDLDVNTQQLTTVVQNNNPQSNLKFFDVTHMRNVSVSSLLYDIWQSSPDHLKTHMIDNHAAKILEKLSRIDNLFTLNSLCRDVRLIIELLSRRDTLVNNTFWRKNWTSLVKGVKSTQLEQIMKLCFRNEKDIAKFKKTHMCIFSKIESYCGELICEGYFDELNDFLNFCTSDQTVLMGWKRTILNNAINKFRFCVFYSDDRAKMQSFDDFIADIYVDSERRRTFKCHMITSATNFEFLQNCVANGFLIPIKNFVNAFLTNEAEIKAVKKELKQQCHRILSKGEFGAFNVQSWNEFLLWCLDDDPKKLEQFKESLSVNEIYQIMFPKCVQEIASRLTKKKIFVDDCIVELKKDDEKEKDQPKKKQNKDFDNDPAVQEAMKGLAWNKYDFIDDYFDGFEKFDNFLFWYFGSMEKANELKLAKTNKRNVLRRINEIKNDRLFLIVLHWCFNRDVKQIDNFTKSVDS